jgi:cell division protein WhiA
MNEKTLSFAASVKEECAALSRPDEEKRSLLSSFVKTTGRLHKTSDGTSLELVSESAAIAKAVYGDLRDLYGVAVRFAYTRSAGFLKRVNYHIIVEREVDDILDDLGIDLLEGKLPSFALQTTEQQAAYLCGAFLAAGSVNDPSSSHYHLEIALSESAYAKWFLHMWRQIANHHFSAKAVERRGKTVLYLKKAEEISDFLVLIGAQEACLRFEDIRVDRDFANIGNRLQNLDSANMGKTLKASERQVQEINYFVGLLGYEGIENIKLRSLMKLRIAHPDATLEELSKMLSEELASEVSKSNINHLFRYLDEEYQKAKNHEKRK